MSASEGTLTLTDTHATLRRKRSSEATVARVLGEDCGSDGARIVYLDSLIHHHEGEELDGWTLSGAISTVCTLPPRNNDRTDQPL